MKRFLLEITVFVCGAVVMAFEIVGSRMLGPYVGTSAFVWSSIIGIILLSLAVGYYAGGRLSDRFPKPVLLAVIILLAALFMLFTVFIKNILLDFLTDASGNIKLISILASLLLFSPPAVLLGMVSPFAVRLRIHSVTTSGATAGNLYALSTLGSILGTFLAGFVLIPSFTITGIVVKLSLALMVAGILMFFEKKPDHSTTVEI